tara:strand:- start:1299 stop:1505 length:207 start_codon:yes stop_codon:yes gene_type:complete
MDIERLKQLAGVNEYKGYTEYTLENISKTASEKSAIMKKEKIEPGTNEWFKLWFSLPHLTGSNFRSRK